MPPLSHIWRLCLTVSPYTLAGMNSPPRLAGKMIDLICSGARKSIQYRHLAPTQQTDLRCENLKLEKYWMKRKQYIAASFLELVHTVCRQRQYDLTPRKDIPKTIIILLASGKLWFLTNPGSIPVVFADRCPGTFRPLTCLTIHAHNNQAQVKFRSYDIPANLKGAYSRLRAG